jgi:hypothetical protein
MRRINFFPRLGSGGFRFFQALESRAARLHCWRAAGEFQSNVFAALVHLVNP